MSLQKLLYATIATWEISERLRREDYLFDAWEHFACLLGYKHPSNLRKMCQPHEGGNNAKLGVEESFTIMNVTGDYRMLQFLLNDLILRTPIDDSEALSKVLLGTHISLEQKIKVEGRS